MTAPYWHGERATDKAVYTFSRGCHLLVDHGTEWCATTFPDGKRAVGKVEHHHRGARALAEALGLDLWTRMWQHELIHTWLAEVEGMSYSPTLRAVADGWTPPPDGEGIRNEERATESVHFLLVQGHIPMLEHFIGTPTWTGTEWQT